MKKQINILHLGCSVAPNYTFVESLLSFMQKDPRINIKSKEIREMRKLGFGESERKIVLLGLNRHLLSSGVITRHLKANDVHQIFSFNIPYGKEMFKLVFDAFDVYPYHLDYAVKPETLAEVRSALSNAYDVCGLCRTCCTCKEGGLGLTEDAIYKIRDYDAGMEINPRITPEEIFEILRCKRII